MKTQIRIFSILLIFVFFASITNAQKKVYNSVAGVSQVYKTVEDDETGDTRTVVTEEAYRGPKEKKKDKRAFSRFMLKSDVEESQGGYVPVDVDVDKHGNAAGNQYDLAVDGAFEGETIAVIHLYTTGVFDFGLPKAALKEKGFSVYRWINAPPSPEELEEALEKSCQLWIISHSSQMLNAEHVKVIRKFFDEGHGIYIWGDNDPFNADANYLAKELFGAQMTGNYIGSQTVGIKSEKTLGGIIPNHLITTGMQFVYEGITIATIHDNKDLKPLIYDSQGNVVAAYYEKDGKRAILDGGFTRMYCSWEEAGTGRYIKNAAAWLVNYERFAQN